MKGILRGGNLFPRVFCIERWDCQDKNRWHISVLPQSLSCFI